MRFSPFQAIVCTLVFVAAAFIPASSRATVVTDYSLLECRFGGSTSGSGSTANEVHLKPESRCHRESGDECELTFVPHPEARTHVGVYWDCDTADGTTEHCTLKVVSCDDDGFCVQRDREPDCLGMNGAPCDTSNVPETELEPLVIRPEWRCDTNLGLEICDVVLRVCYSDGTCFEL